MRSQRGAEGGNAGGDQEEAQSGNQYNPYHCQKCGAKFNTAQKLAVHMAKTNDAAHGARRAAHQTNYHCQKCEAKFNTKQKLAVHMARTRDAAHGAR